MNLPPHSLDAEKALLGSMLLSPEVAEEAASLLSPEDFYRPAHQRIFTAIRSLTDSGREVDSVSVADALGGELEQSGGKPYIVELGSSVPTTANWKGYADIIVRNARLGRVMRECGEIANDASQGSEPEELSGRLEKLASSLSVKSGGVRSVQGVLGSLDLTAKVDYLWSELLPKTRIHRGDFLVIGGRPGVGKSAFAAQVASELAARHIRVRIYSYEMSAEDYTRRFIQSHTGITRYEQDDGLSPEKAAWITETMAGDWQRFVEIDDSCPSVPELRRDIRRFAHDRGRFVVIDHLQILCKKDTEAVAEASRALKLSANDSKLNRGDDLRPAVCALSQLNRGSVRDDGTLRPPDLSLLKQSGAIEEDADGVALLHHFDEFRDEKAREVMEKRGYVLEFDPRKQAVPTSQYKTLSQVELAKNRHGRKKSYPAWWSGEDQAWSFVDRKEA